MAKKISTTNICSRIPNAVFSRYLYMGQAYVNVADHRFFVGDSEGVAQEIGGNWRKAQIKPYSHYNRVDLSLPQSLPVSIPNPVDFAYDQYSEFFIEFFTTSTTVIGTNFDYSVTWQNSSEQSKFTGIGVLSTNPSVPVLNRSVVIKFFTFGGSASWKTKIEWINY